MILHESRGSRAWLGFGRAGRKAAWCMEKHTDGFRPMKTEHFHVRLTQPCALCCDVMCCDVLSSTRAVSWWISTPDRLFVLLAHMCGVTHCSLCAHVQRRLRAWVTWLWPRKSGGSLTVSWSAFVRTQGRSTRSWSSIRTRNWMYEVNFIRRVCSDMNGHAEKWRTSVVASGC